MKSLFTYSYGEEKMKAIEALGYELFFAKETDIPITEEMAGIEVLVCYDPFERVDIARFPQLKWIQLSSIGIDQLPKEKVLQQGITVTNNRSGYSIPMGEWIVMKLLELFKNSRFSYEKQAAKRWEIDTSLLELYHKTVCFVGTGSIATEAAKRLQGFDVNILGINTTGRDVPYFDRCYPMDKLKEALSQADVVVLSIPYTKETHHLIHQGNIGDIKKGACLINIARGSILEEAALVDALKSGHLRGAALDVFEQEPLLQDSPLWELPNIAITPHNSWISEMRNERRYQIIYENLKRYISGEKLMNVVDIKRGY
jgi:phosphoglycerate dehydrogenase-like enzyme